MESKQKMQKKIEPAEPARFISAYGKKNQVQFNCTGVSLTKQSMKDECDINLIVAKFDKTKLVTHVNDHQAEYGFATSEDFTESMQIISQANEMFGQLPAKTRNYFNNDPGQFLDYVQDEKNKDDLYEMGLSNEPQQKEVKQEAKKPDSEKKSEKKSETLDKTAE